MAEKENFYPPCKACTLARLTCERQCCFRDGGPFGISGCFDAVCCSESSEPDKPYKMFGLQKSSGQDACCFTGDDGVDAEMEAFAVQVDMPEGEDLCPCIYCFCVNYSCYSKFPDNCNGGALETEACCCFCFRTKEECEFTMFPFQACQRLSGSLACCDFQRPEGEDDVFASAQCVGEACCLCEFKQLLSTVFRVFWDPCFCVQCRYQLLCCVAQAALPTTDEVPCALAFAGIYCYGEDAVNAVSDEKNLQPGTST